MRFHFGRASGLTAALLLAAGAVHAQEATTPEAAGAAGGAGLAQAVQAAEEAVQGRVFEAELESEGNQLVYELELVDQSNDIHQVQIDTETGAILSQDEQTVEGLWERWLNGDELEAVLTAETPLSGIISSVETETGATVIEASIDTEDGRAVYEMELSGAGGEEIELIADAATGEILSREVDD